MGTERHDKSAMELGVDLRKVPAAVADVARELADNVHEQAGELVESANGALAISPRLSPMRFLTGQFARFALHSGSDGAVGVIMSRR